MMRIFFSIFVLFSLAACTPNTTTPVVYYFDDTSSLPTENPQTLIKLYIAQTFDGRTQVAWAVQHTLTAMVPATPPIPSSTPLPALTLTSQVPLVSVSVETNCRSGPGTVFPTLGVLHVGESAEVVGRSVNKDSWIIKLPSNPEVTCWLWGQYAKVVGNTDKVTAYNPPPTPTMAEISTVYAVQQTPDYTGPTFSNINISPATIQETGCGSPDSFTITATVTDPSGVQRVWVALEEPSRTHAEPAPDLAPLGGNVYQAVVRPQVEENNLSNLGVWAVGLDAYDNKGNWSQIAIAGYVTVVCVQ